MRGKRQIGLALAGDSMFGFAVNSILGFFGYSTHTTEDVEHINANQDHIGEVEHHVKPAEKFAKQMLEKAHEWENREFMVELLLHVSTSMQGIFETYELYMAGLSVLFQRRALYPLSVERKEVLKRVRSLQHKERGRGNGSLECMACRVVLCVHSEFKHLDNGSHPGGKTRIVLSPE